MIKFAVKTKQLFLGKTTGFSLAMFFPISLTWAKNEAVLNPILEIMPGLVVFVVSLAAVTAIITSFVGIMKLRNNTSEGLPAMEFSTLFSGGGLVVAFSSGLSSSRELNTVLVIASVINIGIFVGSFS